MTSSSESSSKFLTSTSQVAIEVVWPDNKLYEGLNHPWVTMLNISTVGSSSIKSAVVGSPPDNSLGLLWWQISAASGDGAMEAMVRWIMSMHGGGPVSTRWFVVSRIWIALIPS